MAVAAPDDCPNGVIAPLFTWRTAIASRHGPKSSVTRHVLLTISLHMNERGESCFPSTRTLAEETALSRQAVEKHINWSCENGWLVRYEREKGGQGWRRMGYEPSAPDGVRKAVAEDLGKRGQRGRPRSEKVAILDNKGGQPGCPEGFKSTPDNREAAPPPVPAKPKKKVATVVPSDFKPSNEQRVLAEELGLDVDDQCDEFKNDSVAKHRLYVQPGPAFTNWLKRSARWRDERGGARPAPRDDDHDDDDWRGSGGARVL